MPYKDKNRDREWHKDHMRQKRAVTPDLVTPYIVTPSVTPDVETLGSLRKLIKDKEAVTSVKPKAYTKAHQAR